MQLKDAFETDVQRAKEPHIVDICTSKKAQCTYLWSKMSAEGENAANWQTHDVERAEIDQRSHLLPSTAPCNPYFASRSSSSIIEIIVLHRHASSYIVERRFFRTPERTPWMLSRNEETARSLTKTATFCMTSMSLLNARPTAFLKHK
jgi:hypothetical protein